MTATLNVTFGATSAVKRILLFTINVTVLFLGITCSVLCLYQVKLMPETYDVIVAALLKSNWTTTTPIPSFTIIAIGIRNNGRNTTRSGGSNNERPRVSRYVNPKKGKKTSNQQIFDYPVTFMQNFTSTNETGTTTTSYLDVQRLDMTKGMALSGTGKTASLTTSSTLAKSSVAGSNITITRVVTPTSLMNTMEETVDFKQVLKDRKAELENELRLAQLTEKVAKSVEQENQTSTTVSSPIPFPIEKLNLTDIQTSSIAHAITAPVTSWPSILLPTASIQQLTAPPKTWTTSMTTKSSSYPTFLITTSLSAASASSTPTTLLSPTSQQTLAVTSTTKPAATPVMLTTPPSKDSTASIIVASRTTPMVKSTTAAATRLASTWIVSAAKSTSSTTLLTPTAPTPGTTSAATIREVSAPATTATRAVTKIPKTTLAFTSTTLSITFDDAPSIESSKSETSTLPGDDKVLLTQLNPTDAFLSTEAQAALVTSSAEDQVSPTSIKAMTNLPPITGLLLPSIQTAAPLTTPLMVTSLSSSTEKASTSSSIITATIQTLPTMNATTSSVLLSTKSISTSTTTPSSIGFINLTGVWDSISKLVGRRDLSAHRLNKRSTASTVAPAINSADTLTADHIPIYFEQVFFFVQTSLYVCTAAGLLIFFSSLIGICGGLFRIDGCLKFSVAALVLVIMAEMATTGFIFVAHDKASNRNKNKNFDRDLKLLCELANFCIQPILLVITGSFLCLSVVLQIGSITLACNLMENRTETDPGKKMRRMMRSNHSNFQFGAGNMQMDPYSNPMPMPMPYCGGGGYGGMSGNLLPYPSPMMMPMQNMGYYPPVFSGPGQRPIVNIIS